MTAHSPTPFGGRLPDYPDSFTCNDTLLIGMAPPNAPLRCIVVPDERLLLCGPRQSLPISLLAVCQALAAPIKVNIA